MLNTGLLTLPATHGDVETEALNTDVMRFLAIIALCLLAVFAAVSSEMPQSAREMIEVQANMIQVQQAEASQLQADRSDLQEQLRKQNRRVELLTAQLQQAQQEQAQKQVSDTDILEEQLRALQIESNALSKALNQSDSDLNRVSAELQRESETNVQLLKTVAMLQQQLNQRSLDLQQSETEVQQQIAQQQFHEQQELQAQQELQQDVEQIEPDEMVVEFPADPVAEPTPLTLSFASVNALMNLVDNGRVQLMAIALPNMWRYDPQAEHFLPLHGREFLYEINKVPGSIKALAAATTGEHNLKWGVVMDASIRAELELLISNNDGGGIIVNADGSLSHRR